MVSAWHCDKRVVEGKAFLVCISLFYYACTVRQSVLTLPLFVISWPYFVTAVLPGYLLYYFFLHTGQGFPQIIPVLANLISHTFIRPMGKIKVDIFSRV